MGELIVSLAGTQVGKALALAFALLSAVSHAIFGAIHKSGADPFLNRGAINIVYGTLALPFALFVFPLPSAELWHILAVVFALHIVYEWYQAACYARGEFTLVYPIARGTGPLIVCVLAWVVFGESLTLS